MDTTPVAVYFWELFYYFVVSMVPTTICMLSFIFPQLLESFSSEYDTYYVYAVIYIAATP